MNNVALGKACVSEVKTEDMKQLLKCSVMVSFKIGNRGGSMNEATDAE